MEPTLDILRGFLDILHSVVSRATTIRLCKFSTVPHDNSVFLIQEICRLEVLGYDIDAYRSVDDCDDTFDNVKPIDIRV